MTKDVHYYVQPHHYEIARKRGIHKKHVDNRFYQKGWDLERAITQPVLRRSDHNWEKWKSVSKVSKDTYMQRVRKLGWDEEKAALTPPLKPNQWSRRRKVFTDHEIQIMKENNIPYDTAYMRYKKLGWSKEESITKPVMTKEKSLKIARNRGGFWKKENKIFYMGVKKECSTTTIMSSDSGKRLPIV